MIVAIFLFHCFSAWETDGFGVAYEGNVLMQATRSGLTKYTIPKFAEKISDAQSIDDSPFKITKSTLTEIDFEDGSQISELGLFCFARLLLTKANFSNCVKLKKLKQGSLKECSMIEEIIFPPNLEIISAGSLMGLANLVSLNFPASLKSFGDYESGYGYAISECYKLKNATFTDDSLLERIGSYSFANCDLDAIIIPQNVNYIGMSTYMKCPIIDIYVHPQNLYFSTDGKILLNNDKTTIILVPCLINGTYSISSGIKILGRGSFQYSSIEEVLIPNSLTSINDESFASSLIKKIIIPSSVTTIKLAAFKSCNNLESVEFNANIITVEDNLFIYCKKLKSLRIPSSVKTIKSGAFNGCAEIDYIFIPKSVETIKSGVFRNINSTAIIEFEAGSPIRFENDTIFNSDFTHIISYIGSDSNFDLIIKSCITEIGDLAYADLQIKSITFENDNILEKIGDHAFRSASITQITLPISVQSIGQASFSSCTKLQKVSFGTSLTSIGDSAFASCSLLEGITLPSSIKNISDKSFQNCKKLSYIEFDSNCKLESIGSLAFQNTNVDELILPTFFYQLGENAFEGSALRSLTFPTDTAMQTIQLRAFRNCKKLSQISMGGITGIGQYSFESCTSLADLNIGRKVTSIGVYAFKGCNSLETITLRNSESLESIGSFAFAECSMLSKFVVGDNEKFITELDDSVLYTENHERLIIFLPNSPYTEIKVSAGTKILADYAFEGAKSLERVFIPDGLIQSIGFCAFSGCVRLSSMRIPSTVREIKNLAFEGCSSLGCGSIDAVGLEDLLIKIGVNPVALSPCPTSMFSLKVDIYSPISSGILLSGLFESSSSVDSTENK